MTFPDEGSFATFAALKTIRMQKKYFITLLLITGCLGVTRAQSSPASDTRTREQKTVITGGVTLESNMSAFFHSGVSGGKSRMKPGGSAGGFLNLSIVRSFSVQGEILFHYKTSDFESDNRKGEFTYWGMEIPVYIMYHLSFTKGNRMYLGIGPYTEFGFGASFCYNGTKQDLYEKSGTTGLPALCDSNTGFGVKAGYEFASGFQINASYKASVTNLLDENSSRIKMRPQTLSLGVGYRFGK